MLHTGKGKNWRVHIFRAKVWTLLTSVKFILKQQQQQICAAFRSESAAETLERMSGDLCVSYGGAMATSRGGCWSCSARPRPRSWINGNDRLITGYFGVQLVKAGKSASYNRSKRRRGRTCLSSCPPAAFSLRKSPFFPLVYFQPVCV